MIIMLFLLFMFELVAYICILANLLVLAHNTGVALCSIILLSTSLYIVSCIKEFLETK